MTKTTPKAPAAKAAAKPGALAPTDTTEAVVAATEPAGGVTPPAEAQAPVGGDALAAADEAKSEDLLRKAEAVAKPGDELADLLAGKAAPRLAIRSTVPRGHRRAGRRWTAEPVTVSADDFSEAELEVLATDPRLQVTLAKAEE